MATTEARSLNAEEGAREGGLDGPRKGKRFEKRVTSKKPN